MKRCPTCQRRYADETLNFCLEDGSPLAAFNPATDETLTLESGEPPPTEILDPSLAPTLGSRPAKPAAPTARQQARPTRREEMQNFAAAPATPPARSTTSVVMLTVTATILLLGLGGLGAWLLLRDTGDGTEVSRDGGNTGARPTPTSTPDLRDGNANTRPPTPTPATPTPTPQQTPTPRDPTGTRGEVAGALEGWRRTMNNPDVDAHMAYYADVLHTYYNAKNVGVSMVRNNVARAFSAYDTFDVRIDNLQIEVDPSGERAVATFDKTFVFRGGQKVYEGSGLNRFWFERVGGRWLITGEKDLKIYYVNK